MMRRTRFRSAALPVALLLPFLQGSVAPVAGDRMLAGRVLDAASGGPVAGAEVMVAGTAVGSLTSAQGGFLLRGVPDQVPLEVVVRHACFHPVRVEVADSGDVALEVGLPFRPAAPMARARGACVGYGPSGDGS